MKSLIITLCGSNRFEDYFKAWNEHLTLAGHAVFTTAVYPSFKKGKVKWYTEKEKVILDEVHLKKINASDAIFLINPFAYIGESTLNEIEHAQKKNKLLFALESWGKGNGLSPNHTDYINKKAKSFGVPEYFASPINTTSKNKFHGYWSEHLFGFGPSDLRSKAMNSLKKYGTE